MPTGHLVYAVGDVLFAVPFDVSKLEVKGGPVPIVTGIQRAIGPATTTASANFGFSDGGALVYLNETALPAVVQTTLGIVDRNGGAMRRLDVPVGIYRSPRVSPDGRQLAVETISEAGQNIIWVYDLAGGKAMRRLTEEGNNTRPVWSRDGKKIAYGSDREKPYGIFWQAADGSGLPERLTSVSDPGVQHYPESFSPDGKVLSFASVQVQPNAWGLWTLALDDPEKKPKLFYDVAQSNEFGSMFSPDGKWIAYASNEGPQSQFGIYVQPYPATGVKYQISRSGGAWPVWSLGGTELIYRLNTLISSAPKVNAVTITTKPVPAFTSEKALPIQGFVPVINYREYDILPNGKELVMVFPTSQQAPAAPPPPSIHVVLNWFGELRQRVAVK